MKMMVFSESSGVPAMAWNIVNTYVPDNPKQEYEIRSVDRPTRQGNRYYVYTTIYFGEICIPYHARKSVYIDKSREIAGEYADFFKYRHAWEDWLEMHEDKRRNYVKEYKNRRKNNLNNSNLNTNDILKMNAAILKETLLKKAFVTFPCGMKPQTVAQTECQKEKEMNTVEFATERRALLEDLGKSFRAHQDKLAEKFHIHGTEPKTMADVIRLIKEKKFEHADDEKELNKEYRWDNPIHMFRFREHPADEAGYEKALDKMKEQYRNVDTRVKALPPAEAIKDVEAFRTLH
jgi:hypothetical protein